MPRFLVAVFCVALGASQPVDAAVLFTDSFSTNGTDSPPWGNQSGNWSANNGVYAAASPSASPLTYSSLTSFDLTDFSFQVDVNDISDGGIWLRSDYNGGQENGVLLVLGGGGFGSGVTTPPAGHELYWHVVQNGVPGVGHNIIGDEFTPGENATVRVDVVGDTYSAFVNGTLASTFVDSTYTHGQVGLYDFYSSLSFDNAELNTVPEPASGAIFASLVLGMVALRRGRSTALQASAR